MGYLRLLGSLSHLLKLNFELQVLVLQYPQQLVSLKPWLNSQWSAHLEHPHLEVSSSALLRALPAQKPKRPMPGWEDRPLQLQHLHHLGSSMQLREQKLLLE